VDTDRFIDDFLKVLGYPRRANVWADKSWRPCYPRVEGCSWLTVQDVTEEMLREFITKYKSAGVSKAYFSSEVNDFMRDLFVYEFDVEGCESIQCIRGRLNLRNSIIYSIGKPLIYYNGHKSIYLIYFLKPHVPTNWSPKYMLTNIDASQLAALTPFRIPYTLHPKSKSRGFAVDWDLKPADPIIEFTNPREILEPLRKSLPKASPRLVEKAGAETSEVPGWVFQLIEYLKSTGELCHFARLAVAEWFLFKAYKEKGLIDEGDIEAITDIFRKYAGDFNERITKYQIRYVWESWISKGGKPLRCETVLEKCGNHDVPPLTCE